MRRLLFCLIIAISAPSPALAEIVQYYADCDGSTNWYILPFYNNGSDAAHLNLCVETNHSIYNNHYDYVYGESYSKKFYIGTCEKAYRWWWTDDGSIPSYCR
jgi:hypothetical protein